MFETTRTYQTRISAEADEVLSDYATLMARVEHCLFADFTKGKKLTDLKSSYLMQFGITARQFNAVRVRLEGKIHSIQQRQSQLIEEKKQQIAALEERVAKILDDQLLHQKRRRLAALRHKLKKLETEKNAGHISLCFGSRRLFHKQFHLRENGYNAHADWKRDWQDARKGEIFTLGSKDESGGNQTCTASVSGDGSISLRVRLPDSLAIKHGKYFVIPNLRFAYGHEVIMTAIQNCQLRRDLQLLNDPNYKNLGQAITIRFKKCPKGWYVLISTDISLPRPITSKEKGVIGVDINSDHLAVVEIDRFGNVLASHTMALPPKSATHTQWRAAIGEASKQIISLCEKTQKPLILEDLDFQKKKAQLREKHNSYARMLSSFAYQSILTHLKSRGASKGIQVHGVNPAFTSLIGRVNYARRYGLSIHHAAALCIGRRYLGLSERIPQGRRDIPDGKCGQITLDLPVRNRSRHAWQQWRQLSKKCSAALTAHFRTAPADPRAPRSS